MQLPLQRNPSSPFDGFPLEEAIADWLLAVPDKAVQHLSELSLVLSTDIGLKREENQDCLAAVRVHPQNPSSMPFLCVVVSDGMGGMVNGAECASITVAGMLGSLIRNPDGPAEKRLYNAAMEANGLVHRFAGGRGGATLSAVLVEASGAAYSVNVGDSRIYGIRGTSLERLTKDDTLQEAFGGHGRELVQFIGVGQALMPHTRQLPFDNESFLLTTDGIHFIEKSLFEEIIFNAQDLRRIADRVTALSRWLGGRDNASIAAFHLASVAAYLRQPASRRISFWGASSPLQLITFGFETAPARQAAQAASAVGPIDQAQAPQATDESAHKSPQRRRSKKKSDTNKAQLQITIESGDENK
jgi:serine/threonine protein phosphatase PrpC